MNKRMSVESVDRMSKIPRQPRQPRIMDTIRSVIRELQPQVLPQKAAEEEETEEEETEEEETEAQWEDRMRDFLVLNPQCYKAWSNGNMEEMQKRAYFPLPIRQKCSMKQNKNKEAKVVPEDSRTILGKVADTVARYHHDDLCSFIHMLISRTDDTTVNMMRKIVKIGEPAMSMKKKNYLKNFVKSAEYKSLLSFTVQFLIGVAPSTPTILLMNEIISFKAERKCQWYSDTTVEKMVDLLQEKKQRWSRCVTTNLINCAWIYEVVPLIWSTFSEIPEKEWNAQLDGFITQLGQAIEPIPGYVVDVEEWSARNDAREAVEARGDTLAYYHDRFPSLYDAPSSAY